MFDGVGDVELNFTEEELKILEKLSEQLEKECNNE